MRLPPESAASVAKMLFEDSLRPVVPALAFRAAWGSLSEAGDPAPPPGLGTDILATAGWLSSVAERPALLGRVLDALCRESGDPHTLYLSKVSAESLYAQLQGLPSTYPGFTLFRSGARFVVGDVAPRSAAERAGLRPGDAVERIGARAVTYGMRDLIEASPASGDGTLRVVGKRAESDLDLTLDLDETSLPAVETRRLDDRTGYLKLRWVATSTDPRTDASALTAGALAAFAADGVRNLVLDLRSNPGGYGVARVASLFVREDPLLYYESAGSEPEPARNTRPDVVFDGSMAVLIDEQSFSSAELIALALRECRGAPLVGEPSGGGLNATKHQLLPDGGLLMVPARKALGARTRVTPAHMRLEPDIRVSNRTPEEIRAGIDRQLERACALFS